MNIKIENLSKEYIFLNPNRHGLSSVLGLNENQMVLIGLSPRNAQASPY